MRRGVRGIPSRFAFVMVGTLLVIGYSLMFAEAMDECRGRGGVLALGFPWYVCVEKR